MKESTQKRIEQCRAWLEEKYENFWELPAPERRLLAMAYLVDVVKVREVGGNNKGPWVETFLDSVGLGEGYAWCAAMLTFASIVARAPYPLRSEGYNPAAVLGWRRWAKAKGYLVSEPVRGAVCMYKATATTGHIGVMARPGHTLEGNTSSGSSGSQRDGGGAYRRNRDDSYWSWGFALC